MDCRFTCIPGTSAHDGHFTCIPGTFAHHDEVDDESMIVPMIMLGVIVLLGCTRAAACAQPQQGADALNGLDERSNARQIRVMRWFELFHISGDLGTAINAPHGSPCAKSVEVMQGAGLVCLRCVACCRLEGCPLAHGRSAWSPVCRALCAVRGSSKQVDVEYC